MAPKDTTSFLNMERLEKTKKLIELYRSSECLWNSQSPGFHSGSVKEDAWRRITSQLNSGLTPDQVKLQVLGLRNYYSKECAAIRLGQRAGYCHVPRHAYFEDLHFLGNLDFGETKKPEDNFSLVNRLLDDVLILDDSSTIKANYPPTFSESTFCDHAALLTPCSSETKCGFTLYNMFLEPEPDQPLRNQYHPNTGRATSGNDRWYPTSYCVQCNQEENKDSCPACDDRGQDRSPHSESESSLKGGQCGCCDPGKSSQVQTAPQSQARSKAVIQNQTQNQYLAQVECTCSKKSQKRNGNENHTQDECPCSSQNRQKRSPRTNQNGVFVDMGNWDGNESTNNGAHNDNWPGPRLCYQTRKQWVPRERRVVSDDGKKPCSGGWKRNNEAICKRLQDQLVKQQNQSGNYSEEGDSSDDRNRSYKQNERRQSGEDQLNVMLLKKNEQGNSANDQALYQNNQPISDQGYYNSSQPVQNQCYCTYNQSNPDPQRCDIQACQCVYCNRSLAPPQANYYPPPQSEQSPTNYPQSGPPPNQPYGGMENEYGRYGYPNQPIVYCINTEDPEIWVQAQSTAPASNPAQMPRVPPSKSWQQEIQDGPPAPNYTAPYDASFPQNGLDNIHSSNINAILQPEHPIHHPTAKRRQRPPMENYQFVECPAYKREPQPNYQRDRSNRGNYQNQKRSADTDEDSLASRENPNIHQRPARRQLRNDNQNGQRNEIDQEFVENPNQERRRDYDDESPSRRRQRNQNSDRSPQIKKPYEERPTQGRSRNYNRVVSNPNSNYEDSSPSRSRRDRTENPNKFKGYQLESDDSQNEEYPAYYRPKECPNLECPHREDRIAAKTRPPARNRDYEEEGKPSSNGRSRGRDRNLPENGTYEEQQQGPKARSYGRGREDIVKPKKKSAEETINSKGRTQECNDETCPFGGYSLRQDRDRTERQPRNMQDIRNPKNGNGKYQSSRRRDYQCNDDTCPYAPSADPPKERSRKPLQERGDEDKVLRKRYRSESASRNQPRDTKKTKDPEKSKKELDNFGKTRNEAPEGCDDCECDSEENEYEPTGLMNDERNYDNPEDRGPPEEINQYPKREERDVPPKNNRNNSRSAKDYRNENNEKSPRGYRNEYKNTTSGRTEMDNFYSDGYDGNTEYDAYPIRDNRNRSHKESNNYDRTEANRRDQRIKGNNAYSSEGEDQSYPMSDKKNNIRKQNEGNMSPKKKPDSWGADAYKLEYECLCSEDELPQTENGYINSMPNRDPQESRNPRVLDNNKEKIQNRTTGNMLDVDDTKGKDYQQFEKKNTNTLPETPSPNKNDKKNPNDNGKDERGNGNNIGGCKCHPDNRSSIEDCICIPLTEPKEPKITVMNQRKQAGSICMALNVLMDCEGQREESTGIANKPPGQANVVAKLNKFKMEQMAGKTKPRESLPVSNNGTHSPSEKSSPSPKSGKSSKSASPIRLLGTPRTQPGEPIKRRVATATTGGQSSAKRTMDTNAAANRRR
ncbi:homeobox protein 2 isoform X2 [Drosophila rhopaloa]|uniref:Homeobox protein 2 isoform X2 n=1 Tax=Drosophila rhopaloa TaxID=1041015 RepID=A0A6P4DWZ6_DRORH|nr:homeobox protein 2 isoform X2 [Drosophila rhopaloa]